MLENDFLDLEPAEDDTGLEEGALDLVTERRDPIAIPEERIPTVLVSLRNVLESALSDKVALDKKITRWRSIFRLTPPEPPFEGALTVTTPAARSKIDGVRAHIKNALAREPYFTALALTPEAQDAASAFEAVMQQELNNSGGLQAFDYAIDDAIIAGTGMLQMAVEESQAGELHVVVRHVPIEHVYVFPNARLPKHQLIFIRRYWKPLWELQQDAGLGYYDPKAVESISAFIGMPPGRPGEESPQALVDPSNRLFELYEIWMRLDGRLHVFHFHRETNTLLAAYPNPYEDVMDEPPFFPVYIDPDPIAFWGLGLSETLEALQDVADAAVNNELWSAQYKMRPPILVKHGSKLAKTLVQQGGLFPGQVLTFDGGTAEEIYNIPQYAVNPFNLQMLQLVGQMVEDSVLPDMIVPGMPLGGRKTASEIQVTFASGSAKLVSYLRYVRVGLEELAAKFWRFIAFYRIATATEPFMPRGVYISYGSPSRRGRFYVALKDVDQVVTGGDGRQYRIRIHGALRDDFRWVTSGNTTQPERELRLQRLLQIANPAFFQMLDMARQDRGKWHILKRFLDALGLGQEVYNILGEEPSDQPSISEIVMQGMAKGALGGQNGNTQEAGDTGP